MPARPREATAARAVDGAGRTLTPGLIDCHVHLCFDGIGDFAADAARLHASPMLAPIKAVRNAAKHLARGVTTVRDLGGIGTCELASAIEDGVVPGPRVVAAGRALTVTGGHGHNVALRPPGGRRRRRTQGRPRGDPRRGRRDQGGGHRRRAHPRDRRHVHRVHARGAGRRGRRSPQVEPGRRRARDRRRGRHPVGHRRGRFRGALRAAHDGVGPPHGRTRHLPRTHPVRGLRHDREPRGHARPMPWRRSAR